MSFSFFHFKKTPTRTCSIRPALAPPHPPGHPSAAAFTVAVASRSAVRDRRSAAPKKAAGGAACGGGGRVVRQSPVGAQSPPPPPRVEGGPTPRSIHPNPAFIARHFPKSRPRRRRRRRWRRRRPQRGRQAPPVRQRQWRHPTPGGPADGGCFHGWARSRLSTVGIYIDAARVRIVEAGGGGRQSLLCRAAAAVGGLRLCHCGALKEAAVNVSSAVPVAGRSRTPPPPPPPLSTPPPSPPPPSAESSMATNATSATASGTLSAAAAPLPQPGPSCVAPPATHLPTGGLWGSRPPYRRRRHHRRRRSHHNRCHRRLHPWGVPGRVGRSVGHFARGL